MIEWIQAQTEEEARKLGGQILNALLLEHEKEPVLLLCSGGSALSVLDHASPEALHESSLICPVDERYSREPSASNSLALLATPFAEKAKVPIFSARPQEGESLEDASLRFACALQDWMNEHPEGVKLALLGIGADGHTAGIFPHPHDFSDRFEQGIVVGYTANGKTSYPVRMTTTLSLLRTVSHALVYGSQEKRGVLEKVKEEHGSLAESPARIFREIQDTRIVYV